MGDCCRAADANAMNALVLVDAADALALAPLANRLRADPEGEALAAAGDALPSSMSRRELDGDGLPTPGGVPTAMRAGTRGEMATGDCLACCIWSICSICCICCIWGIWSMFCCCADSCACVTDAKSNAVDAPAADLGVIAPFCVGVMEPEYCRIGVMAPFCAVGVMEPPNFRVGVIALVGVIAPVCVGVMEPFCCCCCSWASCCCI